MRPRGGGGNRIPHVQREGRNQAPDSMVLLRPEKRNALQFQGSAHPSPIDYLRVVRELIAEAGSAHLTGLSGMGPISAN
jgi:hypothetical protein